MPHRRDALNSGIRIRFRAIGIAAFALFASGSLGSSVHAQTVRYRVVIENTWSEETHPNGAFPGVEYDPHFSWFGGGTHNDQVAFWEVGKPTSPGMTQMAEDGRTYELESEFDTAIGAGRAGSFFPWRNWVCPVGVSHVSCGTNTREFEIHEDFPLVTLVSMLGPSPDWFVGVAGLPLRENDRWRRQVVVDLHPYDGGTRSRNVWALFGPRHEPPRPIELITTESGQLVGPGKMGTFTFTLLTLPPARAFRRGDCNDDGTVDISDVIFSLDAQFGRERHRRCNKSCDSNDDGVLDVSDAVHTILALFSDLVIPTPGVVDCGEDLTEDELDCEATTCAE